MGTEHLTRRARSVLESTSPIRRFFTESPWVSRASEPDICDFTIGNPHDIAPQSYVEALKRWIEPRDKNWYAYTMNLPSAREIVAQSLRKWRGVAFEAEDVFLTNGVSGGLLVILGAILEPGDEVIFISPPWFHYEGMIMAAGGVPVRQRIDMGTYDLDLAGIEGAITARTRAIIINSPHNPTGKIYPPETLQALGQILGAAGKRNGRPIYLLSDEAYSRIVFDNRDYHSPTAFHPYSFLMYTYTKSLLTPGERLGYIALPPEMPHREEMREIIYGFQMLSGWVFPSALLQHALGDLEQIPVDIQHLQRKRDRLVVALRDMGYEANLPEGTFYIIVRSPVADDYAFGTMLAEFDILCMPGAALELPGYFRLSITANDGMIERSLPGFAAAFKRAKEVKQP